VIYVTDTHPLVFWSSNRRRRLGNRARRILQETEQGKHSIIVPIVVLEEINRLVERKIVRLEVPFRRWAEELERSPNFQVQAYTLEVCWNRYRSRQSVTRQIEPSSQQPASSAARSSPPMNLFETVSGSIRFGTDRREIILLDRSDRPAEVVFASEFRTKSR
jgi:PIN domain nuclease of toxin-antitoxin system